jgi:N6-adenosine-specific RNA methylase IME4/ParB-like chromosome segregation protein Spo0J
MSAAPVARQFHPLANVLPVMEGTDFDRLVADIAEHGLLNPITIHDDMILDGRNRERACCAAGIEATYVPFTGDDPAAFVLSQNLARRHLGPSERAMVAARMANLKWGQRADYAEGQICTSAAAKLVGVSERIVKSAKAVLEHGTADLQEAVDHGRLAVHEAEKAARLSAKDQAEFLTAVAGGKRPSAWQKNYSRVRRAALLAASTLALPKKRWPLILADFPWDFHTWGPDSQGKHVANKYPLMSCEEICAFPIPDLATDTAILFLWTTVPNKPQAWKALEAWGFEFKSEIVWDKKISCTGFWVLGQHECLWIATRGNPPLPPLEAVPTSVIRERRREHSRKPEASYAIIERMYPGLPKLELFARQQRPGWDVWGNETEKFKGTA